MTQLAQVTEQLSTIASYEKGYKKTAYFTAVAALKELTPNQFARRKDFLDLYGIGKSMNAKLLEFKNTGKIEYVVEVNEANIKRRTNDTITRIPREQAERIIEPVLNILKLNKNIKHIEVCGSFRRMKDTVADADILICTHTLKGRKSVIDRFL